MAQTQIPYGDDNKKGDDRKKDDWSVSLLFFLSTGGSAQRQFLLADAEGGEDAGEDVIGRGGEPNPSGSDGGVAYMVDYEAATTGTCYSSNLAPGMSLQSIPNSLLGAYLYQTDQDGGEEMYMVNAGFKVYWHPGAAIVSFALIDPDLPPIADGTHISNSDLVSALSSNNESYAKAVLGDGASTAIAVVQTSGPTTVTFSATNGAVIEGFVPNFLVTPPAAGQTSLPVSTFQYGGGYFAAALVRGPDSSADAVGTPNPNGNITSSNTEVTATATTGDSQSLNLGLDYPAVLLAHGIWGDRTTFADLDQYLTDQDSDGNTAAGMANPYPASWVYPICYSPYLPWFYAETDTYAPTQLDTDPTCEQSAADAIQNGINNLEHVYVLYRIPKGRVDFVGHSMGGLAARYFSSRPSYLQAMTTGQQATALPGRGLGSIHRLITVDTPEEGSGLATFMVSLATQPVLTPNPLCAGTGMTCFNGLKLPLAYPGADPNTGAVASLEPEIINSLSGIPVKPPNSTWIALHASFPDDGSEPHSALRTFLEYVVVAPFYTSASQVPTLSQKMCSSDNDVIVPVSSQIQVQTNWTTQTAGCTQLQSNVTTQLADCRVTLPGRLAHSSLTPGQWPLTKAVAGIFNIYLSDAAVTHPHSNQVQDIIVGSLRPTPPGSDSPAVPVCDP